VPRARIGGQPGDFTGEFLAQVYLRKNPALLHLSDQEEKITELLTDVWCFGAYGAGRPGIARSE
jgi:hypothetical protein